MSDELLFKMMKGAPDDLEITIKFSSFLCYRHIKENFQLSHLRALSTNDESEPRHNCFFIFSG